MNFHFLPLFRRQPAISEIAALRDQNIELGTRVLLLEDFVGRRRKPKRDGAGRFVSPRVAVMEQLVALQSSTDEAARKAAIQAALSMPLTDKQKGRG